MNLRSILLVVCLAVAACGGPSEGACQVSAHECPDPGCCDSACVSAYSLWVGLSTATACDDVGYECRLFTGTCTCSASHAWSCEARPVGPDFAVPNLDDLASGD
jgi:hypothetical protein